MCARAVPAQLASSGSLQDKPPVNMPSLRPSRWLGSPGTCAAAATCPSAAVTADCPALTDSPWFPAGTIGPPAVVWLIREALGAVHSPAMNCTHFVRVYHL